MPDAQTAYELRQALKRPGCPVCRVVRRSGAKYVEGVFYESMLDPRARQKMVDSLGYCYEHTWLIADLKLSDALGQAIVYKDVVGDILKTLDKNAAASGSQAAEALAAKTDCPACQVEKAILERALECLASAIKEPEFLSDYQSSEGLCLQHLRLALPGLDRSQAQALLEPRRAQLESLKKELAEFIRKNDYRFKDEPMGPEGDSHLRAAAWLVGNPRPYKKGDLV